MASKKEWFMAIRLRSLACFFVPVLIAAGYVIYNEPKNFNFIIFIFLIITTVPLQIGLNLINDYQEGIKNIDDNKTEEHIVALSQSEPKKVLYASLFAFAVSSIFGLTIIFMTGHYWLLIIGILSLIAAYCYTGGPWPYGYHMMGEVAALAFPGPVALLGSIYVFNTKISYDAVLIGFALGLLSCSVLMNDNLRDIRHDPLKNKKTLAVAIGDSASRKLYMLEVVLAYILTLVAFLEVKRILFVLLSLPLYFKNIKQITFENVGGQKLRKTLDVSGQALVVFSVLIFIAYVSYSII